MSVPNLEELQLLHNRICQALGDPKRIQIMYALAEQSRNVSALCDLLDVPQPTVSRHLAILRERNLVNTERDGAAIIYSLTDYRIIQVLDMMRDIVRESLANQHNLMT